MNMVLLHDTAVRARVRLLTGTLGHRRRDALARRLLAPVLCLVALVLLGSSPTPAAAASQPPWWSYLPGMGGSGSTQPPWWSYVPGPGDSSAPPATTPPPSPPPSSPGNLTTGSYQGTSGTLAYELYVPSTYNPGSATPLVVALHGCTQTADSFRQLTGWDKLAEQKGFIVVFPEQSTSNNYLGCWNFFLPADMNRGAGEPALIAGITQWVQQHYTVDARRVYVAGMSAGGAMSSVMAATYPDLYAAAGIGSGCEYAATATCAGYQSADPVQAGDAAYAAMGSYARAMPVAVVQGDTDTTVPPINAQQLIQQWQATDGLALNTSVPAAPTSTTTGTAPGGQSYTISEFGDGRGHELIQSWLVHGMGHAWSGGSTSEPYADPSGPDETAAMYAFFVNHPMP
jgi:poly(hydroxyalkanoate) depolymerase family esterase